MLAFSTALILIPLGIVFLVVVISDIYHDWRRHSWFDHLISAALVIYFSGASIIMIHYLLTDLIIPYAAN